MNDRKLTVLGGHEGFYTQDDDFYVRTQLPDRDPAIYVTGNIYCLEAWDRVDYPVDWSHSNLRVLGTFPTLQAMREEHAKGVELIVQSTEDAFEIAAHDNQTDEESRRLKDKEALEAYRPLVQAAKGAILNDLLLYGAKIGIDTEKLLLLQEAGVVIADADVHDYDILLQQEKNVEKTLWKLFEAETDAEHLEILLEWFDKCAEAPYTFLHNPTETNNDVPESSHVPRGKVSRATIREALGDLVVNFRSFGTTALDGEELVSEEVLARAEAIAREQEEGYPGW